MAKQFSIVHAIDICQNFALSTFTGVKNGLLFKVYPGRVDQANEIVNQQDKDSPTFSMFEIQNRIAQRYIFSPSNPQKNRYKFENQRRYLILFQSPSSFMNGIEMFIKLAFLKKERERKKDLATLLPYKVKESRQQKNREIQKFDGALPSLNTQSCIKKPFCIIFRLENSIFNLFLSKSILQTKNLYFSHFYVNQLFSEDTTI